MLVRSSDTVGNRRKARGLQRRMWAGGVAMSGVASMNTSTVLANTSQP
ncbi:MAG: hypothetical protein ACUVVU_02945 [Tepidimonas sp.]